MSDLFHRYKNICYHAANLEVRDPELAEKLAQAAMRRMATLLPLAQSCDRLYQKALVVLTTQYMARQYMRKNRLALPDQNRFLTKPSSLFVLDEVVDTYLQKIASLSQGDRLAVVLRYGYGFSLKDISQVMNCSHKSTAKRLDRADRFLFLNESPGARQKTSAKAKKNQTKEAQYGEGPELKEACRIYISSSLDTIEAIASIDSHDFSKAYESETVTLMLSDSQEQEKSKRTLKGFLKEYGTLLLVVLLILLFTLLLAHFLTRSESKPDEEALSLTTSNREEAQEEVILEDKVVERPYYACYAEDLVFMDPDTSMVYTVSQEGQVNAWGTVQKALDAGYGLQYIGYSREQRTVYLALLSGQGAEIKGNPPQLTITDYWYSNWFARKRETPEAIKKGLVVNQVRYLFR